MHLILGLLQAPAPSAPDLQWFTTLGVGGGLAAFVIVIYRADRLRSEETYRADRKSSEDRLLEVTRNFMTIVQHNTEAMTSLVGEIKNLRR